VVIILRPDVAALLALCLVTAWVFCTGGLNVWPSFRAKSAQTNPVAAILSGMAYVCCGALLVMDPEAGVRVTIWIVGTSAVASAILQLLLAHRLRRLARPPRGNLAASHHRPPWSFPEPKCAAQRQGQIRW